MASTVHVTIGPVSGTATDRTTMPVPGDTPRLKETKTSSGTATAASTSVARADEFWTVTNTGANVWIQFAAAPVAAAATDHLILNGQTRDFAATAGHKFSVIDA